MDSNFTNENDPWEYSLDIDDSDLHLTPVLRSSSSAHVEPSPYTPNPVTIIPGPAGVVQLSNSICVEPSSSTPNPVRIIPGPAGLVQRAKLLKENVFILDPDGALMSTQEYMQKVVEDVGEDADFNSGAWVSATNYVNAFGGTVTGCLGDIDNFLKKGKLEQVVAIVKSCSPNALGDLNVTLKDLSGTVPGTIHYKVLDVGSYEKDITVGAAMILANVSVFTPKPSKHYLNITKRNVVEVFHGPLILNEVLAWYRQRKKELMIFKVDFEKAFDSLRWDFLDLILDKLGFGIKWRAWIKGCLHNSRSFVLVNGSPTEEFELFRGLRQGDPMSPFLFILAMEGLHALTSKAEASGLFKDVEVSNMANIIGCEAANFPLKYLGVPVGCNMSKCSNWNVIIRKFSSKLCYWKARLLSIGGRLSLIK
ncbi:hypothetical protein Tco_1314977 [Tanacetum coccineum]